jgi:hypothetical protein
VLHQTLSWFTMFWQKLSSTFGTPERCCNSNTVNRVSAHRLKRLGRTGRESLASEHKTPSWICPAMHVAIPHCSINPVSNTIARFAELAAVGNVQITTADRHEVLPCHLLGSVQGCQITTFNPGVTASVGHRRGINICIILRCTQEKALTAGLPLRSLASGNRSINMAGMLHYLWWHTVVWSVVSSLTVAASGDQSRPNILFLFTDDQDLHMNSLSYMHSLQKHLVNEGTTFERHYCTISLCCPSRASLWTGLFSHNTNNTDIAPPYGMPRVHQSKIPSQSLLHHPEHSLL